MNYFKDKVRRRIKLRRELSISLVLSVWIIVCAIWPFPPMSYLLDLNSWIKEVWVEEDDYEPPFGHAELMTLRVFCKKMEIDLGEAVRELKANGIEFNSDQQTLEEIGDSNDISPMNLYLLIKKFEPGPNTGKLETYTAESVEVEFSGTGIGNRRLRYVCENVGLESDTALIRLKAAGISGTLDETIKSIAESSDTQPIEIIKILLIEGYKPSAE
jgi:hypothetical protein